MSGNLIDECYKIHVGFVHVLLGGKSWYNIDEDQDVYSSFEHAYEQLCVRISRYMDQLSFDNSEINRCVWYWAFVSLRDLTRVLNTDDLPRLTGLREESNLEDFIESLKYLISITPLSSNLDDLSNWTYFQRKIPMLEKVYRRQCQLKRDMNNIDTLFLDINY